VADKLVTLGKRGSLHARRQALQTVQSNSVVRKLFNEIAPRFAERQGGYTRVLRLGYRPGDAAAMAVIELVDAQIEKT
jgi:large subunit ribosomal protein L17